MRNQFHNIAICLLLGPASMSAVNQQVTYATDAASDLGVTVITANNLDFESGVQAFLYSASSRLSPSALDGVRKYAVIVTNQSHQNIAAIAVRWERSYPGRPPNHEVITLNFRQNRDKTADFKHGHRYMVFPGMEGFGNGSVRTTDRSVSHVVDVYSRASKVDVTVDAVLFENGQIVGPDKSGLSAQYEAQRKAVSDVVDELSKRLATGVPAYQYLRDLAFSEPRLTSVRDALRDSSFQYGVMRRELAGILLSDKITGENPVPRLAQARLLLERLSPLKRSGH